MRAAASVVHTFYGGEAPSRFAIVKHMRTERGRYSQKRLWEAVERSMRAGLIEPGRQVNRQQYTVRLTDAGREILGVNRA